jgi:hypothetical protein
MQKFIINDALLEALDDYDRKSNLMEKHSNVGLPYQGDLKVDVNDDLIYHVPIYDTCQRRFAAFCSFTEAIWYKDQDPRSMGKHFVGHTIPTEFDWFMMWYLFRLCGSGINYVPRYSKENLSDILGTHGYGNFWIIDSILKGRYTWPEWREDLKNRIRPFTDNRGYLLPQFTFEGERSGNHLRKFILDHSEGLVRHIFEKVTKERMEIYQVTDWGNELLNEQGFKKQNFVLTAFAADIAEYMPQYVDPKGWVYCGTNAVKCINAIFPKVSKKIKEFEYLNEVLQFLSNRYSLNPIDCEDARACDVVRYFQEYQSDDHVIKNDGRRMLNNSTLKERWGAVKYKDFADNLK